MSQLCSIRHDIPVPLHTPRACRGMCRSVCINLAIDKSGGERRNTLGCLDEYTHNVLVL